MVHQPSANPPLTNPPSSASASITTMPKPSSPTSTSASATVSEILADLLPEMRPLGKSSRSTTGNPSTTKPKPSTHPNPAIKQNTSGATKTTAPKKATTSKSATTGTTTKPRGATSKPGESEKSTKASNDANKTALANRKKAITHSLKVKQEWDKKVFAMQEMLFEGGVEVEELKKAAAYMQPKHYEEVIVERNASNLCGYPLCPNDLPQRQGRYRISHKELKVYDIAELKSYCSSTCLASSKYLISQLPDDPVYMRNLETLTFDIVPLGLTANTVQTDIDDKKAEAITREQLLTEFVANLLKRLPHASDTKESTNITTANNNNNVKVPAIIIKEKNVEYVEDGKVSANDIPVIPVSNTFGVSAAPDEIEGFRIRFPKRGKKGRKGKKGKREVKKSDESGGGGFFRRVGGDSDDQEGEDEEPSTEILPEYLERKRRAVEEKKARKEERRRQRELRKGAGKESESEKEREGQGINDEGGKLSSGKKGKHVSWSAEVLADENAYPEYEDMVKTAMALRIHDGDNEVGNVKKSGSRTVFRTDMVMERMLEAAENAVTRETGVGGDSDDDESDDDSSESSSESSDDDDDDGDAAKGKGGNGSNAKKGTASTGTRSFGKNKKAAVPPMSTFGRIWTTLEVLVTVETREYLKTGELPSPEETAESLLAWGVDLAALSQRRTIFSKQIVRAVNTIRRNHSIETPIVEDLISLLSTFFFRQSTVVVSALDERILSIVFLKVLSRQIPSLNTEMETKWAKLLEGTGVSEESLGIFVKMFFDSKY
ncbi:RNA polymerase II associated protein 2 [Blyttiomyces sp. JEL0837]|nr:RNA polymerase II associated protein 2 [Blyttiomyces sp. JEL0837]